MLSASKYGNTKATCNDTILRNQYKAMLREHPIHKEFTRSYNRLYARIRRGKLPEDTPLMEELKKLHNEYVERYDNTHKAGRQKVWDEYIKKNKELLG